MGNGQRDRHSPSGKETPHSMAQTLGGEDGK